MTPSLWRPPSSNTMVVFWRLAQPCPQFRNLQPPAANADAKKSCMRTRVYQDKIAFACTQKIQAFADAWSHSLPGANIELSWFHRSHLVLVAAEGTLEDRLGPLSQCHLRRGEGWITLFRTLDRKSALDFAWAAFILSELIFDCPDASLLGGAITKQLKRHVNNGEESCLFLRPPCALSQGRSPKPDRLQG